MNNSSQIGSDNHQGKINKITRLDISQIRLGEIDSEINRKKKEEKLKENAKKYGRDSIRMAELRNAGKEARLAAIPLDLNQFMTEEDKNNYRFGFVEYGNRIILGNLDTLTPEQLETYGKNDYISEIDLRELPDAIKKNMSYIQGYMMALITRDNEGHKKRKQS